MKTICVSLGKNEHQVLNLLEEKVMNMEDIRDNCNNNMIYHFSTLTDVLTRLMFKGVVTCTSHAPEELLSFRTSLNKEQREKLAHKYVFKITEAGKYLLQFFRVRSAA